MMMDTVLLLRKMTLVIEIFAEMRIKDQVTVMISAMQLIALLVLLIVIIVVIVTVE